MNTVNAWVLILGVVLQASNALAEDVAQVPVAPTTQPPTPAATEKTPEKAVEVEAVEKQVSQAVPKLNGRAGLWIRPATTGSAPDLELRTTDGRRLVPSLRNDLLAKVATGQMNELEMQTILHELLALSDSVYIVPATLRDLGNALGVPVDGLDLPLPADCENYTPEMANAASEKIELMSVHVQLALQVQPMTAHYLLGIIQLGGLFPKPAVMAKAN